MRFLKPSLGFFVLKVNKKLHDTGDPLVKFLLLIQGLLLNNNYKEC